MVRRVVVVEERTIEIDAADTASARKSAISLERGNEEFWTKADSANPTIYRTRIASVEQTAAQGNG